MEVNLKLTQGEDLIDAAQMLVGMINGLGGSCHIVFGAGAAVDANDAPPTSLHDDAPYGIDDGLAVSLEYREQSGPSSPDAIPEVTEEEKNAVPVKRKRRSRAKKSEKKSEGLAVALNQISLLADDAPPVGASKEPAEVPAPTLALVPTTNDFLALVARRGAPAAVAALAGVGCARWSECNVDQQIAVLAAMEVA